jgi:dolichol kinase
MGDGLIGSSSLHYFNIFNESVFSLKFNDRISTSGHGLGLVYYSISWTVLALISLNQPWIIAVGIAAMSYGDGMAALIRETVW